MYCSRCGKKVLDNMLYCPFCGAEIIIPEQDGDGAAEPAYFTAADVVFIQRLRILNSGNLPMGFYYGRPVLGPAVGDVGEILQEAGNPTFDPEDAPSVATALRRALAAVNGPLGAANRVKADAEWNMEKTLDRLEGVYATLPTIHKKGNCL